MKVAVLHDYLNQFGGAERVLLVILKIFPEADIYTLLYDKEKTFGFFEGRKIYTSILDIGTVKKHHRMFIPLLPLISELFRGREKYDLVISSTAGYAKGFSVEGKYHISYCHSPLRYAWEIDYLKNLPFSPRVMSRDILYPIARRLKEWDKKASEKVNLFIANSRFIAGKISAYYKRDSEVIYPSVNPVFFREKVKPEEFYLMVGRLIYYKGFNLGIEAFAKMRKQLVIIGRGPEEQKLKGMADSRYVKFVSYVSDEKLRGYYSKAKALVFPQIEDFGLVAAEAQACGLPVISFEKGGGGEIVIPQETGILFDTQSVDGICAAVYEFERKKFDRAKIAKSAERFSEEIFVKKFKEAVRNCGFSVL